MSALPRPSRRTGRLQLPRLPGRGFRTVTGPSDHVVVVGAGLSGLSAALRLVAAGRQVTVLEREAVPGGRAGLVESAVDGGVYRFDTGPTVLTMPDLIADCFDTVGESLTDWLTLRPADPLYRANFADGSRLDVHADPEAMAAEIAGVIGPREADGFRRYVDFVSALYRYELRDFIDRNVDSPLGLLTPNLARLVAAGGFGRLADRVGDFLRDPRTRRVYSFQAMYAGLSPHRALALYAVISYMDSVAGVYVPEGGMHAVPRALAGAAARHGVTFHYGTAATRVEHEAGRARAVHTADGRRIACDAVVLTADLPVAFRELLGVTPRRLQRLRYSPSCYLMLAGSATRYPGTVHHNVHFGAAWREVFDDLASGRLMRDPSFLVTNPTRSDPGLAPAGREIYYVLFPTPNLDAPLDWSRIAPRYREHVLATLQARGYPGFADGIEVEHVTTPQDWAARGMERGAPFAAAHTFGQTGPFRPGNLWGENVVFAGSGTRPGVGVPMVLLSGRLAAERITGPDRAYRSRAWPR
ncbi:MAG TPA: phytoene desaturase family protein [Kineosporiaceae bacterium]|nr:phytoene desaturase family protein [Kineosporiaceae bacterium]